MGKRGPKSIVIPDDAAVLIERHARNGYSKTGIAARMRVSLDTLNKWLEHDPELQAAYEIGRENERRSLHNALYKMAMNKEKPNAVAAIFLLKSRHGYVEGEKPDTGRPLQINFQLPGPVSFEEFQKGMIIDAVADDRDIHIPTERVAITRGS